MKIIHIGRHIRPGGGPAGYLYNLKSIIQKRRSSLLDVWSFSSAEERSAASHNNAPAVITALPLFVRKALVATLVHIRAKRDRAHAKELSEKLTGEKPIFHDQFLAQAFSQVSNTPYGLMPHQPTELSKEVAVLYQHKYKVPYHFVYNLLVQRELSGYQNAEFLISPTKWSLDGYFLEDSESRSIIENKKKSFVVSTAKAPRQSIDRETMRKKLGITNSQLAIGFLGRYIEDKGFDQFLRIARSQENKKGLLFFSAGTGPIALSDSDNVNNLGWRSDIGDIIKALDLVLIPNRLTYFDLLPIECLMLGTPVAVTPTGGNRWLLEHSEESGIFELQLQENGAQNNMTGLLELLPHRVDFENHPLAFPFSEDYFLRQHERLLHEVTP